jgi:uncharacterized protein
LRAFAPPFSSFETKKYTLVITESCNLECDYCYSKKDHSKMTIATAQTIVDWIFKNSHRDDRVQIGLFGGEPFLEFDLVTKITNIITSNQFFNPNTMNIALTTNGTILTEGIIDFLTENRINLWVSCDGPPRIHDLHRHFANGNGSSHLVERNLKIFCKKLPLLSVNAVWSPDTISSLPAIADYLVTLGVKSIILSRNITASWGEEQSRFLSEAYQKLGKMFVSFYRRGSPKFINIIDDKISAILRGGYSACEKCAMGDRELAFSPSGLIYPCERLVGVSESIGEITQKQSIINTKPIQSVAKNKECLECSLKNFCRNWCGCSNFLSTGHYDKVEPFACASEKALILVALEVISQMRSDSTFISNHINGIPKLGILKT